MGKIVRQDKLNQLNQTIPVADLAAGWYTIQITDGKAIGQERLLIQH